MKIYLIILSFFISTISCFAAPEIGEKAPEFSLPAHDGKTYSLADFKGSFVVLEWFNYGCPYVKKIYNRKYSMMQDLQQKWTGVKKGQTKVTWLSIISSAPGKQGYVDAGQAAELKQELGANMDAILLDPEGSVGGLYDAKTTPHMFVIDPEGILRYMGAIDDQPSARASSLQGAKNYVEEVLQALMKGEAVPNPQTKPYGCSVKYKGGWF